MRPSKILSQHSLAWMAGLALLPAALQLQAQNLVTDTFDNEASVTVWSATWGTTPTLEFSTENRGGPAGSGSLKVSALNFTGAGDWEQMVTTRTFDAPVLGSLYASISVDVKVDPISVPTPAGQYGYFEIKRPGSGAAIGTGINLTSTNWTTLTFPLPPTEGELAGVLIQNGNGNFAGPIIYYMDNFRFNAPKTVVNPFDEAAEVDFWSAAWGTTPTLEFSMTENNGGLATSGALKVSADYFTPEANGWEQMVITRSFDPVITALEYAGLTLDVKVDPSSVFGTAARPYGLFEPKKVSSAAFGGLELSSTDWTTVTYNFTANEPDLAAILLQNGSGDFKGPVTYYVDNFAFIKKVGGATLGLLAGPLDDVKRTEVVLNWTLGDGANPVNPASVRLTIDGQAAAATKVTVTKTERGATVVFDDTGTTWNAGEHTWSLAFSDTSTPPKSVTSQGGFIVNPYPTEGTFFIEAEDWNYDGGKWNPMKGVADLDVDVMPYLGNAYAGLGAVAGVDYNGDDANDSDLYRMELDANGENAVNISASNGRYGLDRGTFEVTTNFRFGWVGNGEWHNYTRTFKPGNYTVWAALSRAGRDPGLLAASLDLVSGNPATADQTTQPLGTFNGPGTDGWGRNTLVPMKATDGTIANVAMGGVQTVRFNVGGGDFDYFLFVPAEAPPTPPRISGATLAGGNLTVTWTGGGTLWSATSVTGPWTTTGDSDGSYTKPATNAQEYFRVNR